MRKSNGFTLIELLAVIIILGLLIVLVVPTYTNIYSSIKRQTYGSKVTEINNAAQKYGAKIKDDVKRETDSGSCLIVTIDDLIKEGFLISEENRRNVIYNPTTNKPMEGSISICYCRTTFDIQSFYAEDYDSTTIYAEGDYVRYNKKIYIVNMETFVSGKGAAAIGDKDKKNRPYFTEVTC